MVPINLRGSNFEAYWKLPQGFLTGELLLDKQRACGIIEDPGVGINLKRLTLGDASMFCTVGWPSIPRTLSPILELVDLKSGRAVASVGKTSDGELYFPFSIQSVIETLQLEHYLQTSPDIVALKYARSLYYSLRSLIPRDIQIKFRQSIVHLQEKRVFPAWPMDVSLDNFQRLVLQLILQVSGIDTLPFIWFWPAGHSSAVVLSHDVETQVGHDNVWAIANLEKKYGFRSSWNFVPERYKVNQQLLSDLSADGFEIGVHGLYHDGHLFDTYDLFKRRALRINDYLGNWHSQGFRAPSAIRNLRWIAKHISAEYDTSCPTTEIYAPQPGGCCTVFPFMIDEMVEIPFTMPQDHTLFIILKDQMEDVDCIWQRVASQIMEQNGMVSIIVHPDYMIDANNLARYETFLIWLKEHSSGTWFALPREVAAWWKSRNKQELVHGETGWQVIGPGSESARIAKISLSNENLIFNLET